MKTIVIYDSVFGNTKHVAEKIAKYTKSSAVHIDNFESEATQKYELIIIGSPTRAFNATPELIEKCKQMNLKKIKVAAFDTRIDADKADSKFLAFLMKIFGYATDKIEKAVKRRGATVIGSRGFYVEGKEGPLHEKTDKQIKEWIAKLSI